MLLAGARNNAQNPAVFHLPPSATPPTPPLNHSHLPFLHQYNIAIIKFLKAIFAHVARQHTLLQNTRKSTFLYKVLKNLKKKPFPNKTVRFFQKIIVINLTL